MDTAILSSFDKYTTFSFGNTKLTESELQKKDSELQKKDSELQKQQEEIIKARVEIERLK